MDDRERLKEIEFLNISEAIRCIDPDYKGEYKSVDVDTVVEDVQWLEKQVKYKESLEENAQDLREALGRRQKQVKELEEKLKISHKCTNSLRIIINDYLKQNNHYSRFFQKILELQLYINYTEEELYGEVLKTVDDFLQEEAKNE